MKAPLIPFPQELRPRLPTIVGNVDYRMLRERLEQIDVLLREGGVESDFVRRALEGWNPGGKGGVSAGEQIRYQQRSRRALRCTILRTLLQEAPFGLVCRQSSGLFELSGGLDIASKLGKEVSSSAG